MIIVRITNRRHDTVATFAGDDDTFLEETINEFSEDLRKTDHFLHVSQHGTCKQLHELTETVRELEAAHAARKTG